MASIDVFRNDPKARPFSAGDVLLEDGAASHEEMYVVLAGEVEVVAHGKTAEIVGPGGIFGEMALVDGGPRSAAVIAKTDGKIVPIDQKRFMYLIANTPFFAIEVMRTMASRLRHMNQVL